MIKTALKKAVVKLIENLSSKRFITLGIATWFVYAGIEIDPNWLMLAGFYIGVDYAKNEGVFAAFAEFLKMKRMATNER